jgi:hypothetical protein
MSATLNEGLFRSDPSEAPRDRTFDLGDTPQASRLPVAVRAWTIIGLSALVWAGLIQGVRALLPLS